MIPDVWWVWLIVALFGYLLLGMLALIVAPRVETWLDPEGTEPPWDEASTSAVFWLWPLALFVVICITAAKGPLAFMRITAPARTRVKGRPE